MSQQNIIEIKNLTVTVIDKVLVDNLSLIIPQETIVALVGGSGSGKTTTGLSILRLLPLALKVARGEIFFHGKDLLTVSETQMQKIRGKDVGMVFQDPLMAFNPVFTIGNQIEEVLITHTPLSVLKRNQRVLELLDLVGLPDPRRVIKSYPHQLSGGMRQRAMIAQAIAGDPQLIIADEPTSSLDVTLQAKIMELFRELKNKLRLSILLITHDLGMVEHVADDTAIITEGKIVESGKVSQVFKNPQNGYTKELLNTL